MSVKHFSPTFLDIYRLGSEKEFIFDCGSEKAAYYMRWQLHKLRREMRKENHWLTPVAETVTISLSGTSIIAHPRDSNIEEKLMKALKEQGLRKEVI